MTDVLDIAARRDLFRREIVRTAGEHGVRLVRPRDTKWNRPSRNALGTAGGGGDAAFWLATIRVGAYIEPEWAYWISLHEIGHVELRHPGRHRTTPRPQVHREEVDAWLWAINHSAHPHNAYVIASMVRCLETYDVPWRLQEEIYAAVEKNPVSPIVFRAGEYMRETGGVCF